MKKKGESKRRRPPSARKRIRSPRAAAAPSHAPRHASEGAADSFPIVGIGASAGGLEALEQFLRNVPADSRMAYVVVQHLDPKNKGEWSSCSSARP